MKKAIIAIFIVLILAGMGGYFLMQNKQEAEPKAANYIQVEKTNKQSGPPNEYYAWVAWWNEGNAVDKAITSMDTNGSKIKRVMPMWYKVNNEGQITQIPNIVKMSEVEAAAASKGIILTPTITNDFDPESVSKLLDDQDLQTKAIEYLVFEALSKGYKGWDIDWEELYEGDGQGFNDFVENLSTKMHEKNLQLSVTVQAKTGTKVDAPSSAAQDWKTLAGFADRIIIMGYDFHNSVSEPGPITPLDLYAKMLEIAVKEIPLDKIIIGLPTYGYDWIGEKGTSLQFDEATEFLKSIKNTPKRDPESGELKVNYTKDFKKHTIWYEDSQSTSTRIEMAKAKGLHKFSFWRLGGEDTKIWDL